MPLIVVLAELVQSAKQVKFTVHVLLMSTLASEKYLNQAQDFSTGASVIGEPVVFAARRGR